MRLVTVATNANGYFDFLLESCKRFNAKIDVLGFGEKWQGLAWKMRLVQRYLKKVPDDEIVCFIDAYDVIMLRPLDELEELFNTVGADIVVGEEKHISPFIHLLGIIIFGQCGGLSLNSGTYIGKKSEMEKMLKCYTTPDSDDQVLITNYSNKNPGKVHIDTGSLFFLTIANQLSNFDTDDVIIKKGSLNYKGVRPFFAHGCGNTNMNNLVEKLGYNISKTQIDTLNKWNRDNSIRKIFYYSSMYPHYIAVVIIVIVLVLYLIIKTLLKRK